MKGSRRRPLAAALLAGAACLAALACGHRAEKPAPAPSQPAKHFQSPIFDGLSLGMTRAQAERVHPMRSTVTSGGRNRRVWVYQRRGEYTVHVTFTGRSLKDRIKRIDVLYGARPEPAEAVIASFQETLGRPDVLRRKAVINSYGDQSHEQYETIWSDADQYVFLTERVPVAGRKGRPVYYLTVRRKQLGAAGPPTGYVPPPALDENGKPIEEPVF